VSHSQAHLRHSTKAAAPGRLARCHRSPYTTPLAHHLVKTNQKYTMGVYYSLTENLTLFAEFTDTKAEAHNGVENDSSNFNLGAYLSF
jgi:hypothetical protein